jgi:xylulokinase
MAWIAVDAGTSFIKAVAFSIEGREIALCREPTTVLHRLPEYSEQDMDAVWQAVVKTVQQVVAQLQEPVRGIAITAQGDGCWLVDADGLPTGPAILWNDGRASGIVDTWNRGGLIEEAFPVSGSVPYAGLPNAIFRWLEVNDPQCLARSRCGLTCNGWIFSQMTGRQAVDLSDASNPFGDVAHHMYSDALLTLYGAEKQAFLLPGIAQGKDLIGLLRLGVAQQVGLPARTPVVMAPYDIVATAYGAGVTRPGQACVILGTTICAETITATLDLLGTPAGTTIALGDGLHLRAMPTLTGCETLEWARVMLGLADMDALEALARSAAPRSSGPLFLPYLSPAGERAPFLEPGARGSLHGLSLAHGRAEIARSFYEGLTFGIKECLDTAAHDLREVRVCGGGARSELWCQMIADVTGLDVLRPSENELGARGAFLFGMKTLGEIESVDAGAGRFPVPIKRFYPDKELRSLHIDKYQQFLEVREHARQQWRIRH